MIVVQVHVSVAGCIDLIFGVTYPIGKSISEKLDPRFGSLVVISLQSINNNVLVNTIINICDVFYCKLNLLLKPSSLLSKH